MWPKKSREAGGIPASNIASWDVANWSALGGGLSGPTLSGPTLSGLSWLYIWALAEYSGDLIATGDLTMDRDRGLDDGG